MPKPAAGTALNTAHPLAAGATDFFAFNEGSGTSTANLANASYPASAVGGATWQTHSGTGISGGRVNGGAPAGTAAAFTASNHGNIIAGDFTIRLRFVPISWPADYTPIINKPLGGNREVGVFLGTNGRLSFIQFGGYAGFPSSPLTATPDAICELVVTRTGSTLTIYINASTAGAATVTATDAYAGPIEMGRDSASGTGASNGANVIYDLVSIHNVGWTSQMVTDAWNNPYSMFVQPSLLLRRRRAA